MSLKVYNTLTRRKEDFVPIAPPRVGMYVCGVTVYDYSHIGHARSAIAFDVIHRYLRYRGYDVTYVRNFTDIDDKIIKRAAELGITTEELTATYIRAFMEDMHALGLVDPDVQPHCTQFVTGMIAFIEKLVADGFAYEAGGDVYYRVSRFNEYGKLSGKQLEDLESGARVDVNPCKESPLDFALWKAAKPGEPKWPSPWGEGRPGWHIECSVMSQSCIGQTLDIHGGGKDLVFPHHENEIAQSEAHSGHPYARYWIHNGFVNVPSEDNPEGAKMSKSLGNFYTIRDVLAAYQPEAVKFFMLSTHYRKDVIFTEEGLSAAQNRLSYFYETLQRAEDFLAKTPAEGGRLIDPEQAQAVIREFEAAMDDDFNTQRAFGQLSGVFKWINDLLADSREGVSPADRALTLSSLRADIRRIGSVLGVFSQEPACYFADVKLLCCRQAGIDPEWVESCIATRNAARAARDFATSDAMRDELAARGVLIKDGPQGTTWTVKG